MSNNPRTSRQTTVTSWGILFYFGYDFFIPISPSFREILSDEQHIK